MGKIAKIVVYKETAMPYFRKNVKKEISEGLIKKKKYIRL
jgi:hypothetical protein